MIKIQLNQINNKIKKYYKNNQNYSYNFRMIKKNYNCNYKI